MSAPQPTTAYPAVPADPAALDPAVWTSSFRREAPEGGLAVDGHAATDLAAEHGTPLYVFSEDTFRARARDYREAFVRVLGGHGHEVSVYYAGKAFLCSSVVRWAREAGLNLDTASGGELAMGLAAGMEPERIALHGNNKSDAELTEALRRGVGRIVADSVPELLRIQERAAVLGVRAPVMIRVTPGVHAETHEFIATAHEDQKFGLSLARGTAALNRQALEAEGMLPPEAAEDDSVAMLGALLAEGLPDVDLRGIHCHIGSQIFQPEGFEEAARRVLAFLAELAGRIGRELPEVDLGGGYGIGYVAGDDPRTPEQLAQAMLRTLETAAAEHGIAVPHLSVEPGRSIAGPAGATLYTVGTIKDVVVDDGPVPVRRYVSVDGGMSDNARPILYGSEYTVTLANRAPQGEQVACRVVGKHCETGDIVIRDCWLPADLRAGDLLAVAATGAYCWALSSNYNYLTRPPVLATSAGQPPWTIIRGQTVQNLLDQDPCL